MGTDGLFGAHGAVWGKDRRIVAPGLNQKSMPDYLPSIRTVTLRLIQKWKETQIRQGYVTVNTDLAASSIDIIGLVAFEQDFNFLRSPNCQPGLDIKAMMKIMLVRAMSPIWYWRIPLVGPYLDGGGFVRDRLQATIRQAIRKNSTTEQSVATEWSKRFSPTKKSCRRNGS